MEGKIESFEILESHCANEVKIEFDPSKFRMVERANGYYVVKKQPEYPKTYKECCEILGMSYDYPDIKMVSIEEYSLYSSFIELIRCRNAYWEMAGEQMGLGKSWKPDWNDCAQHKFGLHTLENEIRCIHLHVLKNIILVFPTEEMRDAFYENFKELINNCKELL